MGAGAAPLDSLDLAFEFVSRTGTGGLPMIYDVSFQSWRQFGVTSQPYWVLYDRDGAPVAAQGGAVDWAVVESVL